MVYTYNLDGSVSTVQYPGTNKIITYQPGGAGRPLSAKDVGGGINYATGATYAPAGALMTMVNGGVVTVTNSYNSRVQPVVLSAATTGQTVLSLSYNFHAGNFDNGNIYQIANNRDTTRTQSFTYDNLNRITQANTINTTSSNCWGEVYTIDAWGNQTNRASVSGMNDCKTEQLSAPASLQNQLTGFTYDVAGNMIQNGSAAYTYDGDNRLTATAGWTYVYDGDGVRVEKKNGSTGTLYWTGTGSEAISESDLAGTDKEEYVFFDAERIARRDVATNAMHYYFSDHLGSASIVTNASGAIEEESDYYPYGGEMVITALAPQNYKFTGKERDAESGLDDFGARFHASALGRFMTPDWDAKPVTVPYAKFGDPQTLNLYSYVENAPVNRADADGHQTNLGSACDSGGCASDKELKEKTEALKKAENKKDPPKPDTKPKTKPEKGGNAGLTVGGTALLGVVKAGGAGTVSGSAVVMHNSDTGTSGALAGSAGVMGTAGQKTVGAPSQPADSTAALAYAGVGVGVTFGNAGNAAALKQMTTTFSFNIAFEFGASIDLSGGNGFWQMSITGGVGYGCCFAKVDTTTKTVSTDNEQ